MAKAALAVLLAWGGTTRGDAQGTQRILSSNDYENASSTDWRYTGKQTVSIENPTPLFIPFLGTDVTYGKYASNPGSNKAPGSYVKTISESDLLGQLGSGYVDEAMTQKGYTVEFDFNIKGTTLVHYQTTEFVPAMSPKPILIIKETIICLPCPSIIIMLVMQVQWVGISTT